MEYFGKKGNKRLAELGFGFTEGLSILFCIIIPSFSSDTLIVLKITAKKKQLLLRRLKNCTKASAVHGISLRSGEPGASRMKMPTPAGVGLPA
jgi:hypothetical protein